MSELLPCPFCGNKMKAKGGFFVRHDGETDSKCPLLGLVLSVDGWNRRASSASQDKVVEGLREALKAYETEDFETCKAIAKAALQSKGVGG